MGVGNLIGEIALTDESGIRCLPTTLRPPPVEERACREGSVRPTVTGAALEPQKD